MDKETFENLITIYDKVLHKGGLSKYCSENKEQEKINLLKELDKNSSVILNISLGNLLNNIAYLEKIPKENINTTVEVNNSHFCPPLDIQTYKQIIQTNNLNKITINVNFKKIDKKGYIHIFDISFCSSIDLNNLDYADNIILNNLVIKIVDEKEPTSILFIDKGLEDIPLNITIRTFDDAYYSSFSERNLNTFYKALIKCFNKNKTKKLLKPLN